MIYVLTNLFLCFLIFYFCKIPVFNFIFKVPTFMFSTTTTTWSSVWTNLVIFLHKHGFTVKKQDNCKTGSASTSTDVKSETKTVPSGQAQSPSSQSPFGGPEPARCAADVDVDVFSPADEVFLAPDVLTLSKEAADVKAPQEVQAPGTSDEVLSCGLKPPFFPAQPWPVLLPTTSLWESGNSCLLFPLLFPRVWSLLVLFVCVQAPSLPTFHFWRLCLYIFTFILCLRCLNQRHQNSCRSDMSLQFDWTEQRRDVCIPSKITAKKQMMSYFLPVSWFLFVSVMFPFSFI